MIGIGSRPEEVRIGDYVAIALPFELRFGDDRAIFLALNDVERADCFAISGGPSCENPLRRWPQSAVFILDR